MDAAGRQTVDGCTVAGCYTVIVQRELPLPPGRVWDFLTRPELLARWFADCTPLAPERPFRLEFGDGDFHTGRVVEWVPGIALAFDWTFLGLGPRYRVRFTLLRRGAGTEVSITDRGALDEPEAECLRVGWTELLMRLEKTVVHGRRARFTWRPMITFTLGLGSPGGADDRHREVAAALADAGWYERELGMTAEDLAVAPERIALRLRRAAWPSATCPSAATELSLDFKQIGGAGYLFAMHQGWGTLPAAVAAAERAACLGRWLAAVPGLLGDPAASSLEPAPEPAPEPVLRPAAAWPSARPPGPAAPSPP